MFFLSKLIENSLHSTPINGNFCSNWFFLKCYFLNDKGARVFSVASWHYGGTDWPALVNLTWIASWKNPASQFQEASLDQLGFLRWISMDCFPKFLSHKPFVRNLTHPSACHTKEDMSFISHPCPQFFGRPFPGSWLGSCFLSFAFPPG